MHLVAVAWLASTLEDTQSSFLSDTELAIARLVWKILVL